MARALAAFLLLSILPFAYAHYQFPIVSINGVLSKAWQYVRRPAQYPNDGGEHYIMNPLFDPWSTNLRCGEGASRPAPETKVATVAAGSEIGFGMFQDKTVYHVGPLSMWLSKAPGKVSEYDGSGDWFLISDMGLSWNASAASDSNRVVWDAQGKSFFSAKLPATTPPGEYLFRIQQDQVGAGFNTTQRFVNCAQIKVTGPGGGTPGPLQKIPNPTWSFDRGAWPEFPVYAGNQVTEEHVKAYKRPYGAVWKG